MVWLQLNLQERRTKVAVLHRILQTLIKLHGIECKRHRTQFHQNWTSFQPVTAERRSNL